jgi:hypothetical protein
MPAADRAVTALAAFAARLTVQDLPDEALPAFRHELDRAFERLGTLAADPARSAAMAGARKALSVPGVENAVLDAFSLGCAVGAIGGATDGSGDPSCALLLFAGLAASRDAPGATVDDLLVAAVAGSEVQLRLQAIAASAGASAPHWRLDQLLGYFGVAVTAARLFGLDEAGMESAFGLALTVASGSPQGLATAAPLSWRGAGFAASGGVWAALQAAEGIGARYGALFEQFGLFPLWFGVTDAGGTLEDLGTAFWSIAGGRPYPLPPAGRRVRLPADLAGLREAVCLHLNP